MQASLGSIASLKGICSNTVSKHSKQTKKQTHKENKHFYSTNEKTEINSFKFLAIKLHGTEEKVIIWVDYLLFRDYIEIMHTATRWFASEKV